MSTTCNPIPPTVAQDMVRDLADVLCDRPHETAARREALRRGVVWSMTSLQPRDPVEIMLAGMAITNFHLLLDSARDALRGQLPEMTVKTKSGVVAFNRSVIGLLKELRVAQARPLEGGQEEAATEAAPEPEPVPAEPPTEVEPEKEVPAPEAVPVNAAADDAPPDEDLSAFMRVMEATALPESVSDYEPRQARASAGAD